MKKYGKLTATLLLAAMLCACGPTAERGLMPAETAGGLEETVTVGMTELDETVEYTTESQVVSITPFVEIEPTPESETTVQVTTPIVTTESRTVTLPSWVTTTPKVTLPKAESPEVDTPISAILVYKYNAYAASSAWYGYYYYYFTPTMTETGKTYKTKINILAPTETENVVDVNTSTPAEGAFEQLCDDLYDLGIHELPEEVPIDEDHVIMDGSVYYIVVYLEDGTAITSEGYCAPTYDDAFRNVYTRLMNYAGISGAPYA